MAVKPDVKEWLKAAGVWKPFCDRRDEHKSAGDKPIVAQRKALAEFHYPDGPPAVVSAQAGEPSLVGENGHGQSQS